MARGEEKKQAAEEKKKQAAEEKKEKKEEKKAPAEEKADEQKGNQRQDGDDKKFRIGRGLLLSIGMLMVAVAISSFLPRPPHTPDKGVWGSYDRFPSRFTVKEKKLIIWRMFQTFEIYDDADANLGELSESFSSWVYELFGAGFTNLYDSKGSYNANIRFNLFKDYVFFGSRAAHMYDEFGGVLASGEKESLLTSAISGRRRKLFIYYNNTLLISRKTNTLKDHQRWAISAQNGDTLATLHEFVQEDVWGKAYRGWNVEVRDPSRIDPRIPALLCGIELGAKVLYEAGATNMPTERPTAATPDTSTLETRVKALEEKQAKYEAELATLKTNLEACCPQ